LLVVKKKAAQHEQPVWRYFVTFLVAVEFRVTRRNRDDLVILLALINHRHQTDGAGVNDGQGDHSLLAQHQHIQRIIIFRQSLGNEAVVRRIVNSGVEHAIHLDEPTVFVQFIFDAGARWNFDNGVKLSRQFVSGRYIVPRMEHRQELLHAM
jgi:hypothetical protein